MFAIARVLQKNIARVQPQAFTSVSVYSIQEPTSKKNADNKDKIADVVSLSSYDNKKESELIDGKTLDELKQEECMYHLAKP